MAFFNQRSGYDRLNMFPPVIKALLISNVALFIIGLVVQPMELSVLLPDGTVAGWKTDPLTPYLALWPVSSNYFLPTQYFTYLFMHGGFGHIFFNMLGLW